jgi:hypothetical protein
MSPLTCIHSQTWSLERVFCNPSSSRFVAIVDGPGAITRGQILSSLSCTIIGTSLIILLIVSFLTWFGLGVGEIILMVVLLSIVLYFQVKRVRKMAGLIFRLNKEKEEFHTDDKFTAWFLQTNEQDEQKENADDNNNNNETKDVEKNDERPDVSASRESSAMIDRRKYLERNPSEYIVGPSTGLYIVGKDMRITEASGTFCWFMMFMEVAVGYLWPIISLFLLETPGIAVIYTFAVGIKTIRHYFNIVAVIEETGTMNLAPGKSHTDRWKNQSRLTSIVDKISTDKSRMVWLSIFAFFALIFCGLLIGGIVQGEGVNGGADTTLSKSMSMLHASLSFYAIA